MLTSPSSDVFPHRFRTQLCRDGEKCNRPICFFAHTPEELRQPKEDLPPPNTSSSRQQQDNTTSNNNNKRASFSPFPRLYCCNSAPFTFTLQPQSHLPMPAADGTYVAALHPLQQQHNGGPSLPAAAAAAVAAVPSSFNILHQQQQQQEWSEGTLACGPAYTAAMGTMLGVPVSQYSHSQPLLLQYSASMPTVHFNDPGVVQVQRRRSAPPCITGSEAHSNGEVGDEELVPSQQGQQQQQHEHQSLSTAAARQTPGLPWTMPGSSTCMLHLGVPMSNGAMQLCGPACAAQNRMYNVKQPQQVFIVGPDAYMSQGYLADAAADTQHVAVGMTSNNEPGQIGATAGDADIQSSSAPMTGMPDTQSGSAYLPMGSDRLHLAYYRPT